jgi:NOL1/NOP2/sun family putative RNA methylase
MKLPDAFVQSMREMLGEEAEAFLASYEQHKAAGLRVNRLKLSPGKLQEMMGSTLEPVPWTGDGFYTEAEERPGKHPFYHLGLYYIQEPSAMLPAELLDVRPGHRVLDLCAAPGGKTTQLAAKLQGSGVLVANDRATERTKALVRNVELAGIRNAVVLNEEPAAIADKFGAWFDRVLVDAPCSGEGMFRKDEDMIRQWDVTSPGKYARLQAQILTQAARLVAPGGKLVYSTCTFSPRENEGTIARFLADHPDFSVVPVPLDTNSCFSPGRPDWLNEAEAAGLDAQRRASISGTVRLWPHRCRGEGHFAAVLERQASDNLSVHPAFGSALDGAGRLKAKSARGRHSSSRVRDRNNANDEWAKFDLFRNASLPGWHPPGRLRIFGAAIYSQPEDLPDLTGLHVARPGWMLGTAGKHRFEPSQALAMGISAEDALRVLHLSSEEDACIRYLKGETLHLTPDALEGKGWTLVCIDGFPAGWGRWDGVTLKNERSPGWRWI